MKKSEFYHKIADMYQNVAELMFNCEEEIQKIKDNDEDDIYQAALQLISNSSLSFIDMCTVVQMNFNEDSI